MRDQRRRARSAARRRPWRGRRRACPPRRGRRPTCQTAIDHVDRRARREQAHLAVAAEGERADVAGCEPVAADQLVRRLRGAPRARTAAACSRARPTLRAGRGGRGGGRSPGRARCRSADALEDAGAVVEAVLRTWTLASSQATNSPFIQMTRPSPRVGVCDGVMRIRAPSLRAPRSPRRSSPRCRLALAVGAGEVGGAQPAASARSTADSRAARPRRAMTEPVAQHHRHREERGERVGDALAGDVGRRAVDGLEQARARRRRGCAEGSIPSEPVSIAASSLRMSPNMFSVTITSNSAGARDELHRGVVDEQVLELDVGVLARATPRDDLAPEPRGLEHVGLVDRGDPAARRRARRPRRRRARSARSPRPCSRSRRGARSPSRPLLAEVDAAGELADDQQVGALDPLARSGLASSSAAIGRTGRRFANRPSPLRRPSRPCSGRGASGSVVSHFGPADRAEQHGVGARGRRRAPRR